MNNPSPEAIEAARSICCYCETRFQLEEWDLNTIDMAWLAKKVQRAIDKAIINMGLESCPGCGRPTLNEVKP